MQTPRADVPRPVGSLLLAVALAAADNGQYTMRCEILLFAQLADVIGTDRLAISLPEGATVAEALAKVANDHEAIASVRSTLAVAVNERYCSPSRALSDGDTIALIPPVSGG